MKKFDFNTVEEFDEHIELSIPNYSGLVDISKSLITAFIQNNTSYIDLGCSTGSLCRSVYDELPSDSHNIITGLDTSELHANERLADGNKVLEFYKNDITHKYFLDGFIEASVISSIFTLQFIDPSKRNLILKRCYDKLIESGVFIIAEKVNFENHDLQRVVHGLHYEKKMENFTAEEILKKQIELISSMRPDDMNTLKARLFDAGFKSVETYWSSYGFQAFLCSK